MRNVIFLFLFCLLLRISFAILFQFDGLYGQDPFAYYEYTSALRQALAAGQPPPPFFWPIGYPLTAVLASLVTGLRPLAGQAVSILAGSLVAPLVYHIVLEIEPAARQGGLAAGLLVGTAAQMMLSSLSYMADAAGLAWVTFSALTMLRYLRNLQPRWLALSAFALGWAVITRWVFALAVFPWGLAAFLAWRQANLSRAQWLWLSGLAVLAGGLVLASQFLPAIGQDDLSFTGNLEVTRWNPANAFKSTVTFADGTFNYDRPVGIFYAMPILHPAFIFPLLTPFLLLGAWSFRRRAPYQAAIIFGWPLAMYLFLVGTWENPRFSLAFFPPLVLLTGFGIQALWERPPKRLISKFPLNTYSKYYQPLLFLYLAAALIGSLTWAGRDLRNFTAANNAQIAAVRWVESQIPPQAAVITFGVTLTMQHRTPLNVSEIYHLNPSELREMVEAGFPLYLFLDLENINSQWAGLSPQQNYLWLQENSRLSEIDQYPPYTLFQVTAVP